MTLPVYPGCAVPFTTPTRIVSATPATLAALIKAAQPGDEIQLASGNYGLVKVLGINPSGYVLVTAAPGAAPVLTALQLGASSFFAFTNLLIQSNKISSQSGLVYLNSCHDIVIANNTIQSQSDVSMWFQSDWLTKAPAFGVEVYAGATVTSNNISISNNNIYGVMTPLATSANQMMLYGNIIDNFGDDCFNGCGNNVIIQHNKATNSHNLGGNHNDFIQMGGNAYLEGLQPKDPAGRPITMWFHNWLVDGNTFIAQTDPNLPFPANGIWIGPGQTSPDGIQGIGLSFIDGFTIINNLIIIPDANGIWGVSVNNGSIYNNTVINTLGWSTWIGDFINSANLTVRNNLTCNYETALVVQNLTNQAFIPNPIPYVIGSGQVQDHNLNVTGTRGTPGVKSGVFIQFNPATCQYDLRLAPGSPAIGTGTTIGAPSTDITGSPRNPASIDLGAYAYTQSTTTQNRIAI